MHDELTHGDLRKMQEEIDYRVQVLRPKPVSYTHLRAHET